ncbi:MAG: hypothetical protein HY033_07980 [Ignavibacteriae bacterium]|nr:hypothetical protein [Ignavibacteria bacterium]MBI3364830.1 hypothetical protein [Ignavibacteriota bacterium]
MTRQPPYRTIRHLSVFPAIALILLSIFAVHAQPIPSRATFSHPLNPEVVPVNPARLSPRTFITQPETLRVLAAMVAFQEDNDSRTTGNGSFNLSDTLGRILDAPPHNKEYFHQHLEFAQNYFRKVSDGKLQIVKLALTDSVYRLPYPMQHYSPARSSTTNAELGMLVEDAWHLIDSVTPGIPYEAYDVFILFHAGVGRDIDLVSICGGFDPTPFDLPSIYLNLPALKKIFGDSYQGVAVRNGSYFLKNSIILPETESRYLDCVGANLRLGMNGLLAASIGSHLGLPDLFDTKTGASGIGRFGLMDGQSIFSWNGLFPPEPSAWERYFLGWIRPITISNGDTVYNLPAIGLANQPDSVYRVLISDREYFLVENRNRDANRDGATVTMLIHDSTITRTWYRDTVGFNAFSTSSLVGVVTDVDEFDWSLPGGVNTRTGEWFDGGMLIWHIDENVIDANIAVDAVNADPNRRGVDLEEADGSQDIGQSYGFLDPGSGSEDGTQLDFWYSGNNAPLRRQSNAFTPTSLPDSRSNDLANSHIYMKDFSVRGPYMTARIQVGDGQIAPLSGFPKGMSLATSSKIGRNSVTVSEHVGAQTTAILVSNDFLYGWKPDGHALNGYRSDGIVAFPRSFGSGRVRGKPVVGDFDADGFGDFATIGSFRFVNDLFLFPIIAGWSAITPQSDSTARQLFFSSFTDRAPLFTTSLVLSDSFFAVGTNDATIYVLRHDGSSFDTIRIRSNDSSDIVGINLLGPRNEFVAISENGSLEYFTPGAIPDRITSRELGKSVTASAVSGFLSSSLGQAIALATKDGSVFLMDVYFKDFLGFPVSTGGDILNSPALADIDLDGQKDIVVFSGNKIYAINHAGVILDNFPITTPTSKTILTSPIVADLNGDGLPDIVGVTQEGLVVAYDKSGKMLAGFPLQAGINNGSTPAAFTFSINPRGVAGIGLAVASDDGHVYAWQTGTLGPLPADGIPEWVSPWPQYMHDAQNTGLDDSIPGGTPITPQFFPSERAYNWPNPVGRENGFKTRIRYFVGTDANVQIKIFDIAGDLVTELQGQAVGGVDNEIEWDVSNIQSGIYLAHIDANGAGGNSSTVIKIAVVK